MNREDDPIAAFEAENKATIETYRYAQTWQATSLEWLDLGFRNRYMYNFKWLGRPIIQLPADIVAMQELIWQVKPDLIIETGIAHGGSLILSASVLAMLDYADAAEKGEMLDPSKPKRTVLGVDIDIRKHNRAAIDAHPMRSRIELIEGSSLAPNIADRVRTAASDKNCVLVALDSNHTHDHVIEELRLYAPLVTPGSYCVVFDTVIEDMPDDLFPARPWSKGNNSKTAVWEFLKSHSEFEIDRSMADKLMITAAPDGYLRRR
ncbi:MAG: cephalosporin hydroxylase family protein [Rhodomicrobium sp.]